MNTDPTFLPAEWHEQGAVQLTWPHASTDWYPVLEDVTRCYLEMVKAITAHAHLLIVTPEPTQVHIAILNTLSASIRSHITICKAPINDTWARDHSLLTLLGPKGPRLLDFKFNGWGEKFPSKFDNCICRRIVEQINLKRYYENHLNFVLEGGSIESDGKGTILTTSRCLLAPHRNQPLTQAEIEARLLEYLHAERVLWLDYGYLAGDEEQLKSFRTLEGKPYRLIPLPMATAIYDEDGSRLPATYANFLITNGAVLMPTYGDPAIDRQAEEQIRKAFPQREIIGIDCRVLATQHGSLHCCTMQFPVELCQCCNTDKLKE